MRIVGTGSALPRLALKNDALAGWVDTSDEWIRTRTGIAERRVLCEDTLLDIGKAACEAALEDSGLSPEDMDLIICSTVQGDAITPGLGCMIQGAIGASCPSFDINVACSGFIYALDIADAYISTGRAARVMVVCAEAMSRMADWSDRSTCVLFGDGAGAVVLDGAEDNLIACRLTARSADYLYCPAHMGNGPFLKDRPEGAGYLRMAGQDVFKFAVSSSTSDIVALLGGSGVDADDVDVYLLHQANLRIINLIRSKLGQPEEKFPTMIERTGNTSSATIPIMLDEQRRGGEIARGDLMVMSAFGAGLTTGACLMRM